MATAALDTPKTEAPFHLDTSGATPPPAPKMVSVLLSRHYRPAEDPEPVFEILGYWKDEIKRKNPAGQEIVIQKREFIKGESKPPALAGTGSPDKLLAGTLVRMRRDEAKRCRDLGIGTIEIDED